jgi:hypothetical protein
VAARGPLWLPSQRPLLGLHAIHSFGIPSSVAVAWSEPAVLKIGNFLILITLGLVVHVPSHRVLRNRRKLHKSVPSH